MLCGTCSDNDDVLYCMIDRQVMRVIGDCNGYSRLLMLCMMYLYDGCDLLSVSFSSAMVR